VLELYAKYNLPEAQLTEAQIMQVQKKPSELTEKA
jgi:hypothetical protein